MLLSRSLKALDSLINSKNYEQAEAKLVDISSSLIITFFIPTESKFKSDLLPTILQKVLPITYNEQLNLRLQAESFLTHWYSLLSSFSPVYLLDVYQSLQTTTLQPAAQASLLTFLTNALHYISPELREDYLGTCHSLLLSSQPEFLSHLTQSDWKLLANTFSRQIIPSLVKFLLNTPLAVAVVTFMKKDPEAIIPIITSGSNLQFLKDVIPLVPTSIYISIKLLQARLFEALKSQNSQEISGAIEIIILLINRPRLLDDREAWKEVFDEINVMWETTQVLSQKSAIIDLYTSAARNSMIPINALRRFMFFDSSVPTVLSVAIIRCSAYFIKVEKKLPKGIIPFLETNSIERDPLLFVATIEFLVECFNELYSIAPKSAEKLLDYCINPLPQYFVEQNAILRLIKNIDFNVFPLSKLRTNLLDIILSFINKPHPSVIPEIQSLIDKMKIILPYTELDWFEKAPSYLTLLPYCDPFFITELLDFGLLTAAAYPEAVISIADELTEKDKKVSELLFNRCLYVILESINILKFDFQMVSPLKKIVTKEWSHFCKQLPEMLSMINDNLPSTPFGKIIDSSIYLLSTTTKFLDMPSTRAVDLVEIAKIFGTAFTINSCKLVNEIAKKFKEIRIQNQIKQFFEKIFPYDAAVCVSLSALECLNKYQFESALAYMKVAADTDRSILLRLPNRNKIHCYKTFLALRNEESKKDYINECIRSIPFEDWIIEEEDFEFLESLKDTDTKVHVRDLAFIDDIHRKVVDLCPSIFIIDKETIYDDSNVLQDLPDSVNIGHEISDEFDDDLPDIEKDTIDESELELVSPYQYFVPDKSLLFTFLWFSNRPLPNHEMEEKIEKYSLGQAVNNSRFGLAFLGYAGRRKMKIDIDRWISTIKVDRNDHFTIYSFIILTTCIRKKWDELTEKELKFIKDSMSEIGIHDLSEYNLARIFKEQTGIERMAVDSIISIDPSRFEEFPLFSDMFVDKDPNTDEQFIFGGKMDSILDMMKEAENSPLLYETLSLFSKHILPIPDIYSPNSFDVPLGVPFLQKYYHTKISIEDLPQYEIPQPSTPSENSDFIDKLILYFEKNRTLDYFLFQLIFKFKLTYNQYIRIVMALKPFSHNNPVRIHLALKYISLVESNTNFTSLPIDEFKPPSFTRHFVSVIISPYCPKMQHKDLVGFCHKLKPVFYNLLFIGFDKYSEKLFDHSFKPNYTFALLFKEQPSDIISALKNYCSSISSGGVIVSKQFLQLDSERLCKYFNTNSRESAILEVCTKIINAIINDDCSMHYVCQAFNAVLDYAPPMEIYMTVSVEKVLNAPQFLNIFLIVHMFLKKLETSAKEEEIENQKNKELAEKELKEAQESKDKSDDTTEDTENVEETKEIKEAENTEEAKETENNEEIKDADNNEEAKETENNEEIKDADNNEEANETENTKEAEKAENTEEAKETDNDKIKEIVTSNKEKEKKKKEKKEKKKGGFFSRNKGKERLSAQSSKEKVETLEEKDDDETKESQVIKESALRDIVKESREAKEAWEMTKDGLPTKVSDKERARLLFCDNTLKALAEILHYNIQ
ncbi:hypothetical protein M9Y10_002244 [Tritrichomonas musculus]|uniref:Uncharacterized protein n=1 Tax=Tritrichomonas musculus TaxID=1915356 RepID=A0ABR2L983_9EUKA